MISHEITDSITRSSWIRKMFEEGSRLKEEFGKDNVFDFSIGNPDVDPPEDFFRALDKISSVRETGVHGYMPNAGYPFILEKVADKVTKEHGVDVSASNVIMTCGAAGGLNIIFKTILNPGDEVIIIKPYFVEYGFYINNHQGKAVIVNSQVDFSLDIEAIKNSITDKTKAVLINSPNNPTGKIYKEAELKGLSKVLESYNSNDRVIFLISDEPYREIVFDDVSVPSILAVYDHSIIVTSFSKTLSIPGERMGYVVSHPKIAMGETLMAGLVLCNRVLGFLNAPAFMQRVTGEILNTSVNVDVYKKRRDIFVAGLQDGGYECQKPEGTFYIFCKSPIEDDVAFTKHLQNYKILVVPGSGFGGPGYFRIAFCVSDKTIIDALPAFKEAMIAIT